MCKSRLLNIAVEKKVMWQQEINEDNSRGKFLTPRTDLLAKSHILYIGDNKTVGILPQYAIFTGTENVMNYVWRFISQFTGTQVNF